MALDTDPSGGTLDALCAAHGWAKGGPCTKLLWLQRALVFMEQMRWVATQDELAPSVSAAYDVTMKKHNNAVVKLVF